MTCETVTGVGGWIDELLVIDKPYIQNGFVRVNDSKPGLGADLNPDVAKGHLAEGELWWS
jgi:L-alanine-DL-glutamate epimerase-like enolase superfamily enzyme